MYVIVVTDYEFNEAELCPICGTTKEDESCLKVHLMMTHRANNPEQLLRALRGSELDVPILSAISKISDNAKKIIKEKKPESNSSSKSRIAHKGAESSMIKLGKENGKG